MSSMEIAISLLGSGILLAVIRLVFMAGKNQTILEQNAKDIHEIKTNHIEHIYTRLGKVEKSVARIMGHLGVKNGSS